MMGTQGVYAPTTWVKRWDPATALYLGFFVSYVGSQKDPKGWIFKSARNMHGETGITPDQQKRCRKILAESGVIEVKTGGIGNQTHVRVNVPLLNLIDELPFSYRRAMLLAPSRQTFDLEDDADFEESYLSGLEEIGAGKIGDLLGRLSDEAGGKALVLLCFERDPSDCHRAMFARWWTAQTGQAVEELQRCGSSHKRQDAQEPLF